MSAGRGLAACLPGDRFADASARPNGSHAVTEDAVKLAAGQAAYDRLILTAGSVNKLLPIPGIADYAHGFRTIAEAMYLRDHIIRQLELAAVTTDPEERRARCTFVVVGAGYTGTEVTANGQLLTARLARTLPGLNPEQIRWMLLDTAPRLLAQLDPRLSKTADRVLRRRGVEVLTGASVTAALDGYVPTTWGSCQGTGRAS
jgi:NADH:ubiquinone reductase (H+-translocating)